MFAGMAGDGEARAGREVDADRQLALRFVEQGEDRPSAAANRSFVIIIAWVWHGRIRHSAGSGHAPASRVLQAHQGCAAPAGKPRRPPLTRLENPLEIQKRLISPLTALKL